MRTSPIRTNPPPPRRRRVALALAVSAAVALPAVACSGDDDDEASTEAGSMTVAITEPTDGAEVGREFDVTVDSSVPLGEPDTGRHHVHLYYDGNTTEGEYDLVYGPSFTVDRLDAGEHTVEAVIANADHSLTDARQEVTVTVGDAATGTGGGGGGGGDDATTTTTEADDDQSDPYGY